MRPVAHGIRRKLQKPRTPCTRPTFGVLYQCRTKALATKIRGDANPFDLSPPRARK